MEKQKFTVVYSSYVGNGHYVTEFSRVETDNVKKLFDDPKFQNIVIIFKGWPETENE